LRVFLEFGFSRICEFLKAPVRRNTSPKIIQPDAAILLLGKFSIIAFYRGYIGLSIKLKQSKLSALKRVAKYCKLRGKVRRIVEYLGGRQLGGRIFQFYC
jgi:hypothetical protein